MMKINSKKSQLFDSIVFGLPAGIAAYVFLGTCQPIMGNAISGLVFAAVGALFMGVGFWAIKQMLFFTTFELTEEGVTKIVSFLGWGFRKIHISFKQPCFIDFRDYRTGFAVSKQWTSWFFARPGNRISFEVADEDRIQVQAIIQKAQPYSPPNHAPIGA